MTLSKLKTAVLSLSLAGTVFSGAAVLAFQGAGGDETGCGHEDAEKCPRNAAANAAKPAVPSKPADARPAAPAPAAGVAQPPLQ